MKYSVNDVATMLETSKPVICRAITQGHLKAEKITDTVGRYGYHYLIDEEDLKEYVLSDHFSGHPEDILRSRAFTRTPILEECYPINLLIACLSIPIDSEEEVPDIWEYDIRNFKKLISTLTDREQRVLEMRYQFGMSLDEVGKALYVTRERVRQIQVKAERKLRHKSATGGVKIIDHSEYDVIKHENNVLKTKIANLEIELNTLRKLDTKNESTEVTKVVTVEDLKNVRTSFPIEEFDFGARCYNCLKRAGFNTLADIIYFDQNQGHIDDEHHIRGQSWRQIRNLGRKSLIKIAKKIFDFCGYRIMDWVENSGYIGPVPIALNEELCNTPIYRGE